MLAVEYLRKGYSGVDIPMAYVVAAGTAATIEATMGASEPRGFTIITSRVAALAICESAGSAIRKLLMTVLYFGAIIV